MSVTKLHERLERIERAYLVALAGRYPETVPDSIWRPAILAAVPDCTTEELIAMFNWRTRKLRSVGPSFGFTDADLIKTLIDFGMCHDCATRAVPLICTCTIAPKDCICSDRCVDALDRWAHPFGGSGPAPCLYPFREQLERARARSREAARSAPSAEGAESEPVGR